MTNTPENGLPFIPTGSTPEHPELWQERLLHRYYEAMCVSLKIWLTWQRYPNPDDAGIMVGKWFDRETAADDRETEGRRPKRVRFATLIGFAEKLKADEAARREARRLQFGQEPGTDEGGPDSAAASPAEAPTARRRFRDYLYYSLINFARDWRRQENKGPASLGGIEEGEDQAAYRDWLRSQGPGRLENPSESEPPVAGQPTGDGEESEAEMPPAVPFGWDVSQALDVLAEVLENFKGTAAAIRRRGNNSELPSWWTMLEISTLRPLLSGHPSASCATMARQYGFKGEKQVRNALAALWRHVREHSPSLMPESAPKMECDLFEFIGIVRKLPERLQKLEPEQRRSLQEILGRALKASFQKLQGLLDEPMAADICHFDLAQTVGSLSTLATDFTDDDRREAWTEVLAMSAQSLGGAPAVRLADVLTASDSPTLHAVKEAAKTRMQRIDSDVPIEVWQMLYHAAIAAALVQKLPRRTALLDAELRAAWQAGAELAWLDDGTRRLFLEASKLLGP